MFIRSERLFLRPGWPEDWAELYAALVDAGTGDSVVHHFASAPWPCSMDDAMVFARRPQDKLLPHFVLTLPGAEGARIVGCAGLARHGGEVELGYWIARAHWGQGYATEAVRAVLPLARALGHRRVVANHFADNPASGRVLAKAGFRRIGGSAQRFGPARDDAIGAVSYAVELDAWCDQDGDGMMRAA